MDIAQFVENTLFRDNPYVGLRSYAVADARLFAGRDVDIANLADLITDRTKRLILLHGVTGCGKSSFLRAGLIPALESDAISIQVLRSEEETERSIFLISTFAPLQQVAIQVHQCISREFETSSRICKRLSDFANHARLDSALGFAEDVYRNPESLVVALEALAEQISRPLLIVVDQAEELFTLRPRSDGDKDRTLFFDFLAAFCDKRFWIQLLLSLRTEFYGQYEFHLRQRMGEHWPITSYFLSTIGKEAMLEAIQRPTLPQAHAQSVGGESPTWQPFNFEDGVAEVIVDDLLERFPGPGALTALQIVCRRVFAQLVGRAGSRRISLNDYRAIGGIDDALEDYITLIILEYCKLERVNPSAVWVSLCEIRATLESLVLRQADGIPVTAYMKRSDFESRGMKKANAFPWRNFVDFGKHPNIRLLRLVETAPDVREEPTEFVALGHDVLALPITRAGERDQTYQAELQAEHAMSRKRGLWYIFGFAITGTVLFSVVAWEGGSNFGRVGVALFGLVTGMGYGSLFFLPIFLASNIRNLDIASLMYERFGPHPLSSIAEQRPLMNVLAFTTRILFAFRVIFLMIQTALPRSKLASRIVTSYDQVFRLASMSRTIQRRRNTTARSTFAPGAENV